MRCLVVLSCGCLSSLLIPSLFAGCAQIDDSTVSLSEPPTIYLPVGGKEDGFEPVVEGQCPGGEPHLPGGRDAAWTIIHLAAADNNLEDLLIDDINEMERGHSGTEQVNILVQLDRESEAGTWRYWVQPDSDPDVINSPLVGFTEAESDTGDWRTLASFGQWAVTCFPASNYAVIIGGHGGGWSEMPEDELDDLRGRAFSAGEPVRLIAPDDTNGTDLRIAELVHALRLIRDVTQRPEDPSYLNRLQYYGSDACLMQTAEVLYDLRNTAEFIIGSEDLEPGAGWPYNTVIRELTQRPYQYAQMPHLLGEVWVENFASSYAPSGGAGQDDYNTLSVINTNYLIRARNQFRQFSTTTTDLLQDFPELFEMIDHTRYNTIRFFDEYVDVRVFLWDLRAQLIDSGLMPEVGERLGDRDERFRILRNAIDTLTEDIWPNLVPYDHAAPLNEGAGGISIFLPLNYHTELLTLTIYEQSEFARSTGWYDLVATVLDYSSSY